MHHKSKIFLLAVVGILVLFALLGILSINHSPARANFLVNSIGSGVLADSNKPGSVGADGSIAYLPISDNKLALIDTHLHSVVGTVDLTPLGCEGPRGIELTPDGTELYILCEGFISRSIVILETTNYSLVATIPRGEQFQQDITFVRNGEYALVVGRNLNSADDIDVIDTSTHTIVNNIPTSGYYLTSIAAHPYLSLAYAGGLRPNYDGGVLVIDTNTFTIQTVIPYSYQVGDVQPSGDGRFLYASAYLYPQGVAKIDLATNTVVDTLPGYGRGGMSISPDASTLYASQVWGGGIAVINTNNLNHITTISTEGDSDGSALTCDGSELYIPQSTDSILVIDTQTNSPIYNIQLPGNGSNHEIAICPRRINDIFTRKSVDKSKAPPGTLVNYTFSFMNFHSSDIDGAILTDTLPISLTYKEGSLSASSGNAGYNNGVIKWTGSIIASESVTVTFGATIAKSTLIGTSLTNTANINADGETYTRTATTEITSFPQYITCLYKPCPPIIAEDFSNPATGWPIMEDDRYKLGYINGEYQILVKQSNDWIFAYGNIGRSDYRISVDARPVTELDGAMGLVFGICNSGFYFYEIRDGMFSLRRNNPFELTWTVLIPWTRSAAIYPGFQTNKLDVYREGYGIKLYANGQLLANTSDYTYTCDGVGMVSEAMSPNFDGRFDNFMVYALTCPDQSSAGLLPNIDSFNFMDKWILDGPMSLFR